MDRLKFVPLLQLARISPPQKHTLRTKIHMDAFNVLRDWKLGDTRELTDKQIRQLEMNGAFDSYDQVYEIEGRKWKVRTKVAHPDSSTVFSLQCVEE